MRPNNLNGVCTSLEKAALMDSDVLDICNLTYGENDTWSCLAAIARERIFETDEFHKLCACCQRFELCGCTEDYYMNNTNKRKNKFKTVDLVYMGLGAVLITICSWISIPTTVPFTMQTFAVFFVLSALGGKRGTVAIIVYVLLGAVGIPVFARFTSGIGILLGNTGGYIVGFIFMGLAYWLIVGLLGKKLWVEILSIVTGIIVLYSFGTAWFMIVYAQANGAVGLTAVLSWCVIPFIIPDLIKLGLALALARRISSVLKLQHGYV